MESIEKMTKSTRFRTLCWLAGDSRQARMRRRHRCGAYQRSLKTLDFTTALYRRDSSLPSVISTGIFIADVKMCVI
jgi:hypothetical protein